MNDDDLFAPAVVDVDSHRLLSSSSTGIDLPLMTIRDDANVERQRLIHRITLLQERLETAETEAERVATNYKHLEDLYSALADKYADARDREEKARISLQRRNEMLLTARLREYKLCKENAIEMSSDIQKTATLSRRLVSPASTSTRTSKLVDASTQTTPLGSSQQVLDMRLRTRQTAEQVSTRFRQKREPSQAPTLLRSDTSSRPLRRHTTERTIGKKASPKMLAMTTTRPLKQRVFADSGCDTDPSTQSTQPSTQSVSVVHMEDCSMPRVSLPAYRECIFEPRTERRPSKLNKFGHLSHAQVVCIPVHDASNHRFQGRSLSPAIRGHSTWLPAALKGQHTARTPTLR